MQQFQVPQFIEVEDKVFGPLTVMQFIYLIGGIGSVTILWFLPLPSIIFWPLAIACGSFFGALAFMKVNGQPFNTVLNNAVTHWAGSRFYMWKRIPHTQKSILPKAPQEEIAPKLTSGKLKDLSWSLDINKTVRK